VSVSSETAVGGLGRAALEALLARQGEGSIDAATRFDALARFEELPVRSALRGGRNWKHDLEKLDLSGVATFDDARASAPLPALPPAAASAGVTIERFSLARNRHRDAFERRFGRAVDTRDDKFASLALAFADDGVFIDVPPGVILEQPLVIDYVAGAAALFPYTLVALGAGSKASVFERLRTLDGAPLFCGIAELLLDERAELTYTIDQRAGQTTRLLMTRRATLGADAQLHVACAELGGLHAVSRLRATALGPGGRVETVALFFSGGSQHVDIETETVHAAGNTQSATIVRSAGTGRGQGRYLGNIKILAQAHGADASLRDDALLLSKGAHIDSVPALEIAANDVRAFHGATIGAISEEELFYAQTRGIARADAERMIALGFFEPALSRFPTEALRAELRVVLEAKLAPPSSA
jgi:Fe-S cluster assembly protein SufD